MKPSLILVAGPSLKKIGIAYRRRLLLDYLVHEQRYRQIFWVYFENNSPLHFAQTKIEHIEIHGQKVVSVKISDSGFLLSYSRLLQFLLLRRVIKDFAKIDFLKIVFTLPRFGILTSQLNHAEIFYDCTDNWVSTRTSTLLSRMFNFLIKQSEEHIARLSNSITTSSPFLYRKMKYFNENTRLVEHGILNDTICIGKIKNFRQEISTNFCYIGSITINKIDIDLLYRTFFAKADWNLLILGNIDSTVLKLENCRLLLSLENVSWMGLVSKSDLRSFTKDIYIGILPYKDNSFTKGIFPLKLKEYIALGLRIVSVNLELPDNYDGLLLRSVADVDLFIDEVECFINESKNISFDYDDFLKNSTWTNQFSKMNIS